MRSSFREQLISVSTSPIEEGKRLFGAVTTVMDVLYTEHLARPRPEYIDVHLVTESVARMFPKQLIAQHGFVYHLATRTVVNRFEDPKLIRELGWEVEVRFRKEDKISPKLGYLKALPHSWLLHEGSGTIIDLIPLGAQPCVDYPVRHAQHPAQPPYNHDPGFGLLQGKLPTEVKVKALWKKLEEWVGESSTINLSAAMN
jgi:hypothetical protein